MHEALNLFEDILRSEYFEKTAMILFLNKKDIFREKVRGRAFPPPPPFARRLAPVPMQQLTGCGRARAQIKTDPLTVCFPEYAGKNDYRPGCQFIKQQFKARNRTADRRIYTHYTNATDSDNFKRVFGSVQRIILRIHLIDVGLMDPSNDLEHDKVEEDFGDEEEFSGQQV
jgi:hypothetical protein